jgi:hypothetical protein
MTASLSRTGKGGMLAPLKTINGTVGAPVYTFTNFPTSGLYIAGAGDVRMSVTGVDRMRWLASGSAPQVRNAAEDGWTDIGSVLLTSEATDTTCFPIFATAATGSQAAKTNTTFTFNSATGDVGIGGRLTLAVGTSNGLSFNRAGTSTQVLFKDDTSTDILTLQNPNGAALVLGTSATERMRIDASGNVTLQEDIVMQTGKTVDGRDVSVDGAKLDGVYGGRVPTAGTSVAGNSGFTVARSTTGTYVITHNLASTTYGFNATPEASATDTTTTCFPTGNTVTVYVRDSGTLTNRGFNFSLIDV